VIIFVFDCFIYAPTMRYEVDSLPLLILVVGILILWMDAKGAGWLAALFRAVLPVCVLYSIFVSAALSITGCCGGLRKQDPELYDKAASLFIPVERRLIGSGTYGAVTARVTAPACIAGNQPILVSGVLAAADLFSLRCIADPKTFVVAWDHWGQPFRLGAPFSATPGQPLLLEISTPALFPLRHAQAGDGATACVVRVDGKEVFRADNCEVYPVAPKEVFLFRNPSPEATCLRSYSGRVMSVERGVY
jgi:hypothetical protein